MKRNPCPYCGEPIEKTDKSIKWPETGGKWVHDHCYDQIQENLGGIEVDEIMERDFYYRIPMEINPPATP